MTPTRAMAAAAYEYLRATPPFRTWNLPPAGDVVFRVVKDVTLFGCHESDGERHYISISHAKVTNTESLLTTMAHEMVHMRQAELGRQPDHGRFFNRLADTVCAAHGFNPDSF